MEQKRTWLRVICDEEEEDDWDRRISPRNRKRVRYVEDVDYDEEEEKDEEDNEQPGPSTQNIHNQRTQEKSESFESWYINHPFISFFFFLIIYLPVFITTYSTMKINKQEGHKSVLQATVTLYVT